MRCTSCGTELPARAKFCFECATPVGTLGAPPRFALPDSYTPKHLAERIINSKAALEGERKQVTVLFADLKGSMELLAERDPEEARRILDPVLKHMIESVHRYEGTVNQVMGDGIMALFGAPLAHEDHAVRACYASLWMQESVKRYAESVRREQGVALQIRVGVNSGEVVVRAIDSDLRMDYTAVGQTTHLAARMEQLATPGSILITPQTLALAEDFIAVRSLGPMSVKGLNEAVEVYEVTGAGPARTRLQAAARRQLTPFVGRDTEMEHLSRVQQLARDGHGQVVAILGEAGVGKSRLLYEFTHSNRITGWLLLECSCVSYGKATSYLPVIDLLKGYFNIHDADNPREMREKVIGKLLPLEHSLSTALPAVLSLLDVSVDDAAWRRLEAGQRRQQTLDAVKRLLLRETREQPLILIFEDLHWVDRETQALLDSLVDSLGSARMLLLVNYRPEYRHGWGSKTSYSQMRLDALPIQSTGEFLQTLLGDDPELAPLKRLLVKRGNPFFLEETVRALRETHVLKGERGQYRLVQPLDSTQVPATVHLVLAARIDRLSPDDKRLLQTASVVGKDVPLTLLEAVVDLPREAVRRSIDRLQAAEFLDERGLYPDLMYSFKHALTHEVTYSGLLHERRRELHGQLVEVMEALHPDRIEEQVERLAHHAVQGHVWEKAVHYLRQAARKAATRSALNDAKAWFEQALGILEMLPSTDDTKQQGFDIRLDLRPVLGQLGEVRQVVRRLREAETIAESLKDDRRRGRVCAAMILVQIIHGELNESLASASRALRIAERLGDLRLHHFTMSQMALAHCDGGDYDRAIDLAAGNLAAMPADWAEERSTNAVPPAIHDRWVLIRSLTELGRFDEAAEYQAEVLRLAEAARHAHSIGVAYSVSASLQLRKGNCVGARSLIEHAITVSLAANAVVFTSSMIATSARIMAELGEASEALNRIRQSERSFERNKLEGHLYGGAVYLALGRACLLLDLMDEASHHAHQALECSSSAYHGVAAHTLQLLGDIARHPDRFDAEHAEAYYLQALSLAEPRGMRPLVAHCHVGLGKLYERTDKRQQAQEHLATATMMYRRMGMTYWLDKAEVEIKALG
jgi:class 3 adenylate cyclase/tetratricopeptide (TPR) repeat protein